LKATLYIAGAALELLGIVLVASPDLVPWALRLVQWIRPRWRRIENRLRRLVGLSPRPIIHEVGIGGAIAVGGNVSAVVGIGPDRSVEEKVAFLLRRDADTQRELNALAERIDSIEAEGQKRAAELRAEMEAHVARELAAANEDYRIARISGAVVLGFGLALTTAANFVS
jgi:hypothetical protein